jgi:NADH-quinone oxidoreductase subunit G
VQPDAVRKELARAVPFFGALAPETRVALEVVGERGA